MSKMASNDCTFSNLHNDWRRRINSDNKMQISSARLLDEARSDCKLAEQTAFTREKCARRVEFKFSAFLHDKNAIIVDNRV